MPTQQLNNYNVNMPSGLLLIVDSDPSSASALVQAAKARNLKAVVAPSLDKVRTLLSPKPDVALIKINSKEQEDDCYAVLDELVHFSEKPFPVLILSARSSLTDLVEIARLGASGFLQMPLAPYMVIEAVVRQLDDVRSAKGKVLLVDSDPDAEETCAILKNAGLQLRHVTDPRLFLDNLEEFTPDIIILNISMPHLSGIELCKVVRNEEKWQMLSVMFIAADYDSNKMNAAYSAGADDFLLKEMIPEQLLIRVENRIERTRIFTRLAGQDPLTGLANRRKSTAALAHLMLLAQRQHQPFSLSVLDLDHFKTVNDTYGHAMGDVVLCKLGNVLLNSFRGEDVVARWGGEEMVIGMYGMNREDGVHRLAEVLDQFRSIKFKAHTGEIFSISFSAGVAEYPKDGVDLHSLYRAADGALYKAKNAGRSRILPSNWESPLPKQNVYDVLLASNDSFLAQAIFDTLSVRGYSSKHLPSLEEMLNAVNHGCHSRALVVDWEQVNADDNQFLEAIIKTGVFEPQKIIFVIPDTRTLQAPLPDYPGIRLMGKKFADYELMKMLRSVWK